MSIDTDGLSQVALYDSTSDVITTDYTPAPAGEWQHLCFSYDGSRANTGIEIYKNGVLSSGTRGGSGTFDGISDTNIDFLIGARGTEASPGLLFDGKIDEVVVFDYELTQDEVDYLYNSGSPEESQQWDFSSVEIVLFELTAKDIYNGTSINNFSAQITNITGSINITTTNGTIYYNYNDLVNITIYDAVDHFGRTYKNYNTTTNLDAELEPSVFKVLARGNISNTSINTFSATISNETFSDTASTESGSLFLSFDKNLNYSLEIFATDYAIYETDITNINGSLEYTYYLYENNSIWVSIYDGVGFYLLDTTTIDVIIDGQDTSFYQATDTSNGTLYLKDLDADTYLFSFSNDDYPQQQYFITLADNEHKDLNAFILNNSFVADVTLQVVDPYGVNVEGAILTMQQLISGAWQTIGQETTDATGSSLFYLRIGTNYRVLISKSGYVTQTASITPTSNPYSVTLQLSPVLSYNYTFPLDCVDSFKISPESGILPLTNTSFNLSISSADGRLSYWGIYYNSTELVNITGSPSGGIANLYLDLNESMNNFVVSYFFKCTSRDYYESNKTYFISDAVYTNNTIINTLQDSDTKTTSIQKMAIILGSIIIALLISFELGIPIQGFSFVVVGVMLIYTIPVVGWINPILTTFISLLLVVPTIASWRGGTFG